MIDLERSSNAGPRSAGVEAPREPLPALALMRTVVRNPIEAWPQAVYEQPVYRRRLLGREAVFIMDPDLVRAALIDEAVQLTKAEAMLRSLEPALGQGLLTADGERWRWQRRAAAPIFRHERIVGFVSDMIAVAEERRASWLSKVGGTIDVAHEMMHTTFDIIVATMLSGRSGIDADQVERSLTDYLESTSWTVALAMVGAPRWMPYPGRRRAERARDYLRAEILRVVATRRASAERRPDLIGLLLDATDPETGRRMSDRDLADNLLTFITAGHETTALALTWTFYLLDLYPGIADRVLAEVAAATGGGPLQAEHVSGLDYTRQVIQEAMRLYPPAPVVVREAANDLTIGGERIAAGSTIYIPIYAIHRHRLVWDEPDSFDPDRFAPEAAAARHRYAFLPFGAGPRICIGMSFALLEAVAILAVLLPAVRLTRASAKDPELKLRITLRPGAGLPMRLGSRTAQQG